MTPTTPTPALADLDNTAKEALRDLSHIENHLQASSAPTTIMNRALDVRMGIKELRTALACRAAQPVAPVEEMARYCPACGSVGEIGEQYRDCCPDGSEARHIPKALAEKCSATHKLAVKHLIATPSPQIAEVAEVPSIDSAEFRQKLRTYHDEASYGSLRVADNNIVAYIDSKLRDAIAASRRAAGGEMLQDAAQAINRLLGAVEGLSYVDSAREFGERTLANILRITEAAPASAGQASTLAEPIYQKLLSAGVWSDEDKDEYDAREGGTWRIVSAQPVAPVQDVLTIPTAIMDIACDHRLHDEYKRGHRDARHAAADLVLARADELKALATPSPQIAEVAELSDERIKEIYEDSTGYGMMQDDAADLRAFARAIAASRRAAGGEATDDLAWNKEALARVRGKLESVWDGIRAAVEKYSGQPCEGEPFDRLDELLARLATPAPASAGQAAPAVIEPTGWREFITNIATPYSEPLNSISGYKDKASRQEFMGILRTTARELLAAQPAEGAGQAKCTGCDPAEGFCRDCREAESAGQAGQVADWQECERISDLPSVNEAFYNFSQDSTADNATCIVRAVLEALPVTERAAAPAEQSSAKESQA